MFALDHQYAEKPRQDAFDRALSLSWIVSGIAMDVCGMLFWSALGLFVLRAAI
jgi:hypothetical protein